jgi:hypothetical protein
MLPLGGSVAEQVFRTIPHAVLGQADVFFILIDLPAGQEQVLFSVLHAMLIPPKLVFPLQFPHQHLGEGVQVVRRVTLFRHPPSFLGFWGPLFD